MSDRPKSHSGLFTGFSTGFQTGTPNARVASFHCAPAPCRAYVCMCVCMFVLFEYMAGRVRAFLGDGCLLAPTDTGGNHRYVMMPAPGQALAHVRCMCSVNE